MQASTRVRKTQSELLRRAEEAGEFDPQVDISSFMESTLSETGGPYGLFTELAHNSEDANASSILFIVEGAGEIYSVTIIDNGEGMGARGRKSFMDVGKSSRRGDPTKRGKHGLGVKRMMAESAQVEVVDICNSDDRDTMVVWEFLWEEYKRRLGGDKSVRLKMYRRPRDAALVGLLPGSTGVRIKLTGWRGRRHSPETIRKNLARYLPPWIAQKVRVADKPGAPGEPLLKREIVGEELRSEVDNHPTLKRMLIHIYIPRNRMDTDTLSVGGREALCTFVEFYERLSPRLQKRVPPVFLNPAVCGVFYVDAFKDFRSGSSKDMDPALFETNLPEVFVNYLEFQVADEVEQALGLVELQSEKEQDQRMTRDLAELCRNLTGRGKTVEPPLPRRLELSVKSVELLPGQKIDIKVRRHADTITAVAFDDLQRSGLFKPRAGVRVPVDSTVEYTAGNKPGVYTLVCRDWEDEDTRAAIEVVIVAEKVLRISPARVTVEPGESVTLSAMNVDDATSGAENLRWRTTDPGGTIRPQRGEKVTYKASMEEGPYEVVASDRKKERVEARCEVTVVAGRTSPPKGGKGAGTLEGDLEIEGVSYETHYIGAKLHPSLSWVKTVGTPVEIHFNKEHPIYRKVKGGYHAKFQIWWHELLMQHVLLVHGKENLSVSEAHGLMTQLHTKAIGGLPDQDDK